jgi:hypothetical protein
MKTEQIDDLRRLLTGERVLALAVLVEGQPAIGLLPFAATPERDALLVNASHLARHTRGLTEGAPFDALVHAPDTPAADPLQIPRVTLRGHVVLLDPAGAEYASDQRAYVERFPEAAAILEQLGGFRLYRLRLEAGRLVSGFAGAVNLDRDSFAELASRS